MTIVVSILPIFLIILAGFFCRRVAFPDAVFWSGAEKMTYYVFFPALLVSKMASAKIGDVDILLLATVLVATLFLTALIMIVGYWFSKRWMIIGRSIGGRAGLYSARLSPAVFTSIFQGGIRFNTYVGLAIVAALYGTQGVVIAVVMAAIMIPLINVLCVSVLEIYRVNYTETHIARRLTLSIVKNPLIIACVLGITINVLGIDLPSVMAQILLLFAQVALPLGLLTVGAALNISAFNTALKPLFVSCAVKFLVLPVIAMSVSYLFGMNELDRQVLLVLSVLPTATASYVLAKQLGGDAELMASIITVQTLLSAVFIPLMLGAI